MRIRFDLVGPFLAISIERELNPVEWPLGNGVPHNTESAEMKPLPHHYSVSARAATEGRVAGRRLLQKAEKSCLVTNSLDLIVDLDAKITMSES